MTITVDDVIKILTVATPLVIAVLAYLQHQSIQSAKVTAAKVDEIHATVTGAPSPVDGSKP